VYFNNISTSTINS